MSWRDNITEQGKFRGAAFYYDRVESEIGRRTKFKIGPGRDGILSVEDLGRAPRRFTIDMFVVGDDYDVLRDALRIAFEKKGPGELEHPYWGKLTVTVDGPVRFTETTKEQGIAKFTATFVQTGKDNLRETVTLDTAEKVLEEAENVSNAAQSTFEKAYSQAQAIASTIQTAIATVQDVASQLENIRAKIASALLVIDEARDAILAVQESVATLIEAPAALASGIRNAVTSVVGGVSSIGDAFEEAIAFFGGEESVPNEGNVIAEKARADVLEGTIDDLRDLPDQLPEVAPAAGVAATAQQQALKQANNDALVRLIRAESISAVSTTAVGLEYDSFDQAQTVRQAITGLIDDLLADPELPDEVYQPVANLRAALVQHFASVANSLPELLDYTPKTTLPALVIAYQIYGDSTKEAEIVARNQQLRDPSAVPGGQVIKVLVDG